MSFTDFTKNDNKSIIWGLLQEGGVFNDIPNSSFENVKRIFESSIYSVKHDFDVFFDNNDEGDDDYDKKASEMIMNGNKNVIKKMMQELGKFKVTRTSNDSENIQQTYPSQQMQTNTNVLPVPPRYNSSTKKSKIEEIYRADDLQKGRMSEIEVRLKEKQEEMDKMLNNKKPTDIDFTDKKAGLNDTKLVSSDMERLLAEALSSRQQELDQVKLKNEQHSSSQSELNAEEWIKGTPTQPGNKNNEVKRPIENINKKPSSSSSSSSEKVSDVYKKNVTFNDKENIKIRYENVLDVSNVSNNLYDDIDDIDHIESRKDINNNHDGTLDTNKIDDNETEIELSILSKLKKNTLKPLNTVYTNDIINNSESLLYKPIPLDTFMNNDDSENNDDNNDNDEDNIIGSNYQNFDYKIAHNYSKSHVTRETGEYKKLEEKINVIKNEIEAIKSMQEKILHILTNVNIEHKTDNL
jgi:hypothetical protein